MRQVLPLTGGGVCEALGLLAVLAASHLPAVAGLGLLLAVDGPLLVGAFRMPGPVHPGRGVTGAAPSQ